MTRLDQILATVTSLHEVTIDATDLPPELVERVFATAKARGLHASGTCRWILIRIPAKVTD
jgi:hypothetical protein